MIASVAVIIIKSTRCCLLCTLELIAVVIISRVLFIQIVKERCIGESVNHCTS